MQGPIRNGAKCWVLHPKCGVRPVAEGIAGSTPPQQDTANGNERSFLMALCEGGDQYVMVTGAYKKSVKVMFPHANTAIRHLEDAVLAPAVSDKTIKWSARYLVDKAAEIQTSNPHHERPTTSKHL